MKKKKFEIIDHPADIGLKVYGKNLSDLFKNAGLALKEICEPEINGRSEKEILLKLVDSSPEELLVKFLNELIYLLTVKNQVPEKIDINVKKLENSFHLKGKVSLTGIGQGAVKREIKAATYHNLSITRRGHLWQTAIILDL